MSGSINLEPQNDAPTAEIAGNNCAYCAVGGLFGVSANAIMKDVFRKTGKKDDDGSMGFAYYYAAISGQELIYGFAVDGGNQQEFQIKGIETYLAMKGRPTRRIGDISPLKLLRPDQLSRQANNLSEGTRFLVLTGECEGVGGLNSEAHWTFGRTQKGRAMFFDYQMKISDDFARSFWSRRTGTELGETGCTNYPVIAWGRGLEDDDGKGMLLVVPGGAASDSCVLL
jgi:hypothetical protein